MAICTIPIIASFVLTVVLTISIANWYYRSLLARRKDAWQEKVQIDYIPKSDYLSLVELTEQQRSDILDLSRANAGQGEAIVHLQKQLDIQKSEMLKLHETMKSEFSALAANLFEDKFTKMAEGNRLQFETLISPFKEKLVSFEKKVEETYVEGAKDRAGIRQLMHVLQEQHKTLGEEAGRLVKALKGDAQFQGSWGEFRLQRLLDLSGLEDGIHYTRQEVFENENERLKPDIVIHLPEDKHIVLDAKVSLVAFEKYFAAGSERERQHQVHEHLKSVHSHLKNLSRKSYETIYRINSPDFVLMFMPMEHAFLLSIREDPKLFEKALMKNITIVSPSTLLATLRTVASVWKHEKQHENAREIARHAGALYDKFSGFLDDMRCIGEKLDGARDAHASAYNKLCMSVRRGDTIVGRLEKIKDLGAHTTKTIKTAAPQ